MSNILVTGSGGFIGHHLTKRLKADGHCVLGVDVKNPDFEPSLADEFSIWDLREPDEAAMGFMYHVDTVYHLACDMGGIGYTTPSNYEQRLNNTRIDLNLIDVARRHAVTTFFYASSACVYNEYLQGEYAEPLQEKDAYPARPDLTYGWVKLMGEQALLESGLSARIARFHNVYGELGTWDGGKEKAPAALCRKVALAKLRGDDHIEVWGDGEQRRSFMYVDDCIEGILRLTASDYHEPINLGRDEQVSINELAAVIMDIAEYPCGIRHDLSKPQGVRARNSDNARLREVLGWTPGITLEDGLRRTYQWVEQQVIETYGEKQHE